MTVAVADVALIGLAVMGENLILNMNDHGFKVCVFNRTIAKVNNFMEGRAKGTQIIGATSLEEMVLILKKPRVIILLVMAGKPVDEIIQNLVPLLEKGDIIVDGGNSDYLDSRNRFLHLKEKGIYFVGSGVSGGEKGARYGPSLMPGGASEAWPVIKPIFEKISAKVDNEPCCSWMGPDGSGHFVKMVHNGIEYGDMQLICEAYHILKSLLKLSPIEMSQVFGAWNKTELDSYLIEITKDILAYKDKNGQALVENVRDAAAQKGTGKWTVINGLDMGIPITLIGEAVFARCLSSLKDERVQASKIIKGPVAAFQCQNKEAFIEDIRKALFASKIVSYAQGFMLMREASKKYNWNLDYSKIAMAWRGGCIIRSKFLGNISEAFKKNPDLSCLVLDSFFSNQINECQESWRRVISTSVLNGIPTPAFNSALSFFDGYRSDVLPANLLQAQRDYFGAHTFELLSEPGKFIHCEWGQKE